MKKAIIGSILITLLFLNTTIFSYTLTDKESNAIDQVVEVFQDRIIKNNEKTRDFLVASLNQIIVKYRNDEVKYEILKILTERIDELKFDDITKNDENNVLETEEEDKKIEEDISNEGENGSDKDKVYKTDLTKVRQAWLDWQNEVRQELGLEKYVFNKKLEETASDWANTLYSRGDLDVNSIHKRDLNDTYYNYNKIASWLKDGGVVCKNVDRWTFSESVAWTSYYCPASESDCTDEFEAGLKKSFDRYMSEKDRTEDSRPHYNAIVSDGFKEIGVDFAIKEVKPDYFEVFVTTHYCTEVE